MANWKKVIVSGSSPSFSAISVDGTVTANAFSGDGSGITGISGTSDNNFTNALLSKLNGIESNATADQTAAEIRTLVGNATNSNVFTDADHSKLDGIAANANNFSLSAATTEDIGGIIVGTGLSISDSTLSVSVPTANDFTNTLKSKLDGIESNATADQTAAEIRTLVGSASDSNVFTDADHTKLDGIAAGAEVNPSVGDGGLTQKNFTTTLKNKLDGIAANANNFSLSAATTEDLGGIIVGTGLSISDSTLSVSVPTANDFTNTLKSKLDGIESNATADQTAAEIRTLVGSASDSNVFTDADHTKLDAIEASADVTDKANVKSALSSLNSTDTLNIGDSGNDTTVNIKGNLTVTGTTTTVNTTNLDVTDTFITLNNGNSAADAGIVVEGQGAAFAWDENSNRWGYDFSGANGSTNSVTFDAHAVAVETNSEGVSGASGNYTKTGNLLVNTSNGDIFIYS